MGLLEIILFCIIIYYVFKYLKEIVHTLFSPSAKNYNQRTTQQGSSSQRKQPEAKPQESGNRIIKDDEGEYIDFEEVN
ncbi:MAG: DUF4834 family protein [Bacteroidaceae bacterium]|nr:DUF4834 family protein [Bacteroidaceae bacterium]